MTLRSSGLLLGLIGPLWLLNLNACSLETGAAGKRQNDFTSSRPMGDPTTQTEAPAKNDAIERTSDAATHPQVPDAPSDRDSEQDRRAEESPYRDASVNHCQTSGRYAMRIEAAALWQGKRLLGVVPLLDPGTGSLILTVLADLRREGDDLVGNVRPCGADIPPFSSQSQRERYKLEVRPERWESPGIPTHPVRVKTTCALPGCELVLDQVHLVWGAHLHPPDSPWPSERTGIEYRDHDSDGLDGLTLDALGPEASPTGTEYPPLSLGLIDVRRTNAIGLAIRTVAALQGRFESCGSIRGTATDLQLDTHAADCRVVGPDKAHCNAEELRFLDDHLPRWIVRSASFTAERIASDGDCAAARAAFADM